jgi:hypothetical protein
LDTFQQIQSFNAYTLANFGVNATAKEDYESVWADETTNRARRIAATCASLQDDDASETEWRLRLEELVLARFRLDVEW